MQGGTEDMALMRNHFDQTVRRPRGAARQRAGWVLAPCAAVLVGIGAPAHVGAASAATTGSIGDTVWLDADVNGIIDPDEAGVANAVVRLLDAGGVAEIAVGPDGVLGSADDAPGGVRTAADGHYAFSGLPAATYVVEFSLPSGYRWTTPDAGGPPPLPGHLAGFEDVDSDALAASERAPLARSAPVAVAGQAVSSVDAGIVGDHAIGDLVWSDADADGRFDDGSESGIEDVTVELFADADADGAIDGEESAAVASTWTDEFGRYVFANLVAGGYEVVFTRPDGFVWTAADAGDDGFDSDAHAPTAGDALARTGVIAVGVEITDPDPGEHVRTLTDGTIDAGLVPGTGTPPSSTTTTAPAPPTEPTDPGVGDPPPAADGSSTTTSTTITTLPGAPAVLPPSPRDGQQGNGDSLGAGGALPRTGGNALAFVPWAVGAVAAGGLAIVGARRRRRPA